MAMKLYIDKDKCRISETLNGKMVIETDEEIAVENNGRFYLLFPYYEAFFDPWTSDVMRGTLLRDDEPFLTQCPNYYKL